MIPILITHLGLNFTTIRSVYDKSWVNRNLLLPQDQLTQQERSGLCRAEKITQMILSNTLFLTANAILIGASRNDIGLCETFGSRQSASILFDRRALNFLSQTETDLQKIYRLTWEKKIDEFPSSLGELSNKIEALSEAELLSLVGLYEESLFSLTDDELYFVLKHEILGHFVHGDNEKRLALKVTSLFVMLLFIDLLRKSRGGEQLVALSLISFILPPIVSFLAVEKLKNRQEFEADFCGFNEDERAKRGALSFFKKRVVSDIASRRYYVLTGKVIGDSDNIFFGKIKERFDIGHPSFEKRYAQVHL